MQTSVGAWRRPAPEEHRRALLEIADAWIRVAQDVEREKLAGEQQ